MNLSHVTPPINNACLPDIYNRLDANVQERTRVVNGQLQLKLSKQEKLIAKYKREAERMRRRQRQSATNDLSRIRKVPATVSRIADFDEKFLRGKPGQLIPIEGAPKEKHYLTKTNEDPICKRCYIHHLPTKKKLYRRVNPPPPASVLDPDGNKTTRSQGQDQPRSESPEKKATSAPASVMNPSPDPLASHGHPLDLDPPHSNFLPSPSPELGGYGRRSKLVPLSMKYQFLERSPWGKETDLNDSLTPRLMPNEEWKDVVKNVCKQTQRRLKPIRKPSVVWRGPRMNSFVREKSLVGATNRKLSSRRSSRGHNSRPSSRVVPPSKPISRSNSRSDSFIGKQKARKQSATEATPSRRLSRDHSSMSSKGRMGPDSTSQKVSEGEQGSCQSPRKLSTENSISAKDIERLRLSSPAKSFVATRSAKSGSVLKAHKE